MRTKYSIHVLHLKPFGALEEWGVGFFVLVFQKTFFGRVIFLGAISLDNDDNGKKIKISVKFYNNFLIFVINHIN